MSGRFDARSKTDLYFWMLAGATVVVVTVESVRSNALVLQRMRIPTYPPSVRALDPCVCFVHLVESVFADISNLWTYVYRDVHKGRARRQPYRYLFYCPHHQICLQVRIEQE
jgi:hypothetical protein